MEFETVDESRGAGIAYHLSPTPVWEAQKADRSYVPEAFEQDGFIHATNGLEKLLWVANEFYTGDARPHTVLVLDVSKLESPVRYDDEDQAFPHIYGPLNTDAVISELSVERGPGGEYIAFSSH
jgi:uncharacterized protein (DUF952 family)